MKNCHYLLLISLFVLAGCNGSINQVFTSTPPYEAYLRSLEDAALKHTPMVQAWVAAGQRVFKDSILVNLPFSESGYFSPSEPDARAYRFEANEGQVLTISGKNKASANGRMFLDLFVLKDEEWKRVEQTVALADSTFSLSYEFRRDAIGLLRLQPELLSKAYYTISLSPGPALTNPVSGANNRSIGSLYGVDRDGGRRRHEGVDIFAPRGTPVIAPTDGLVTRVGTNNLGGKVVWLQDRVRGQVYYFAHLDSQLVQSGKKVQQGDTLGLVGNTGNAKTTPPHLHFGIYQSGSKDPIHYLRVLDTIPAATALDTALIKKHYKLIASETKLRTGPNAKQDVVVSLSRDTYVEILAQSGDWYRVRLPDQQQGFVPKKSVQAIEKGKSISLPTGKLLLSEPKEGAVPVMVVNETTAAVAYAQFNDYTFIRTEAKLEGWVKQ